MFFWSYMLVMSLLLPLVMIVVGRLFVKKPPRSVNGAFGYRTRRSMQSQAAWDFAHAYNGRLWLRCGLALLPVSALVMLQCRGGTEGTVGGFAGALCGVQLAVLLLTIVPTEAALRRNFDEKGNRKE